MLVAMSTKLENDNLQLQYANNMYSREVGTLRMRSSNLEAQAGVLRTRSSNLEAQVGVLCKRSFNLESQVNSSRFIQVYTYTRVRLHRPIEVVTVPTCLAPRVVLSVCCNLHAANSEQQHVHDT